MKKIKRIFAILLLFLQSSSFVDSTATVNCVFGTGSPPTCDSFTLSPVTVENEEVVVSGQSATYTDIRSVILNFNSNATLNFLPTNLFKYFPNAQQFSATKTQINTVVTNAIINCASIWKVVLSSNNFPTLPDGFAQSCSAISELTLTYNNITTVHVDAFKGLINLKYLFMSNNNITCIKPGTFAANPNITFIDISRNKITALHPLTFDNLKKIFSIQLQYNSIGYIPNLILAQSTAALTVSFEFNPFSAVDPAFFSTLYQSRTATPRVTLVLKNYEANACIAASDTNATVTTTNWQTASNSYGTCYNNWTPTMATNELVSCVPLPTTTTTSTSTSTTTTTSTTTSSTSTSTTEALTTFGSSNISCPSTKSCRYFLDQFKRYTCVLEDVDGALTAITGTHELGQSDATVERVYFINSFLRKVPAILFQKFPNLEYLYIRNCSLGIIDDETFTECGNLKFLDASYNDIIHVRDTSLRNCTKLQTVDLTGNSIGYISTELYNLEPSLQVIHLHRIADFVLD